MVTCPSEGSFSQYLDEMGIPVRVIGNPLEIYPSLHSWRSYVKYPYLFMQMLMQRHSAYKKLCSCIESFNPDLIHTNVGPIHIGYLAAKKYGIPHVWHIREYQKEDFGMYPFPSGNVFLNRIHDNENHCISITKHIFEHFKLSQAKDKVIYDGVIDRKNAPVINVNKKKYILFVGRLEDAKGIKDLLSAYNQYALNNGLYNLYIAGNGNETYKNECVNIIDKKIKNRVVFLGERKHEEIYELMHDASLFVVPSRNEGFGFITAEAMFNGTIVIGRNTGGTKEQFDNAKKVTGEELAFRFEDLNDLVTLLFKSQNLPDGIYRDMAFKAQKTVCQLYDIEKQADLVYSFYNSILQNRTSLTKRL